MANTMKKQMVENRIKWAIEDQEKTIKQAMEAIKRAANNESFSVNDVIFIETYAKQAREAKIKLDMLIEQQQTMEFLFSE